MKCCGDYQTFTSNVFRDQGITTLLALLGWEVIGLEEPRQAGSSGWMRRTARGPSHVAGRLACSPRRRLGYCAAGDVSSVVRWSIPGLRGCVCRPKATTGRDHPGDLVLGPDEHCFRGQDLLITVALRAVLDVPRDAWHAALTPSGDG